MTKSQPVTAAIPCLDVHFPTAADSNRVYTPHGAAIEVVADFPAGSGPFPAIVLASGRGYHLAMPALAQTAKRLVEHGVAVFRFNWAFFTADAKAGQPSADLSNELEDMQTVLKIARTEPRVAKTKLSVGGKSLGSLVAWQAFTKDKSLRCGLFLTPICSRLKDGQSAPVAEADENYPGIALEHRPLLFVSGDQDPGCSLAILYRFVATAAGNARVAIVGGDHGYENRKLTGPAFEADRMRSINLVALSAAGFVVENVTD
jgi:predicted alpha/beta-hydrolase family hydrolase